MKPLHISLIAAALFISACKSKKNTNTTVPATTSTSTNTTPTGPGFPPKSTDGLYEPGQEELTAAQAQFKDVDLAQLKEGYQVYNNGACIGCHGAKNIYKRPVERWKDIIDDMSARAALSSSQKDAVFKYVMAIKATQK